MPHLPSPAEIAQRLDQQVIGQRTAVRELAVALAKKLGGQRTGNVLMIGSSGSGKTTLMRATERFLAEHPLLASSSTLVRLHANVLGEEAESGRPGAAVLARLVERARERLGFEADWERVLGQARRGIVFIDEVDKIRAHVGERANVPGIRAQEALLTLMENEAVPFDRPAWAGGGVESVDSSELLFVCGGAFEGLYDAVYDRVTIGRDRGALKPTTTVEQGKIVERLRFKLRDWLRPEDLFAYGITPQFFGRFDAVVLLEDLGEAELLKIFLDMPDSALNAARAYFKSRGIELAISPGAVRRIAKEAALQPRLGARALREVFRRVMRDFEFEPERYAQNGVLTVDEAEVETALAAGRGA